MIPADRREEPSPGSLKINNARTTDSGVYVCTASNLEGVANASDYVQVQGMQFQGTLLCLDHDELAST